MPVIEHNRVGQRMENFSSGGWMRESGTCFCGARNYGARGRTGTGWLFNFNSDESSYSEIHCSKCGRVYSAGTGELLRDIAEYVPLHLTRKPPRLSQRDLAAAKATVIQAGLSVVALPENVPPGEYSATESGWEGEAQNRSFHYQIAVRGHIWKGQRCFEQGVERSHSHHKE